MHLRLASPADAAAVLALYDSVKGQPGCLWDEDYPNADIIAYDLAHDGLYLLEAEGALLAQPR